MACHAEFEGNLPQGVAGIILHPEYVFVLFKGAAVCRKHGDNGNTE